MAKSIDELSLNDQLPHSIKTEAQIKSTVYAVDPWLKYLASVRGYPTVLYNVDKWPGEILDHLATGFSLTAWDSTWDVERKRRILKAYLVAYKMHTGTVYAVQRAVESFGPGVSITEWWRKEPKGIPHTFEVRASNDDGTSLTIEEQESLKALIDAAKPVRSHYTMTVGVKQHGSFKVWSGIQSLHIYMFRAFSDRYKEQIALANSFKLHAIAPLLLIYAFRSKRKREKPQSVKASMAVGPFAYPVLIHSFANQNKR